MIAASDDALEATALVKRAIAAAELAAKNEIIASGAPVQEQAPVAMKAWAPKWVPGPRRATAGGRVILLAGHGLTNAIVGSGAVCC